MTEEAGRLESFEEAFHDRCGGCRATCACGQEFYNADNGWTWEAGELEKLADSRAKSLPHAVGYITFEGTTYVVDCECWKARAKIISKFISGHDTQIADYLKAEKKRKVAEAERAPVVV